jgi:lysine 6-dehydrogenase
MGFGTVFDLARCRHVEAVTVADIDIGRAEAVRRKIGAGKVSAVQLDVADSSRTVELMREHHSVVSCVVYHHNLQLAKAAIQARSNFCDLGGNNTVVDAELALNAEAARAGVNIIPDCGLAPGMVCILAAHGIARFEQPEELHIRVGGLPQNPKPPLDYQIVFSVEGLINEYVEPARVLRQGSIVEIESMTEIEELRFPAPFQKMEAFQTSGGTSTLPETYLGRLRALDYKTIRYPGHCEKFKLLIDLGLAGSGERMIGGVRLVPRRLLGELLLSKLPADEPDVVLIRLEFTGMKDGRRGTLRYDIIDWFDEKTGLSAMMRTTAFPASIIAQMMAAGETLEKGAKSQERCVPAERFVRELEKRGIRIEETWES